MDKNKRQQIIFNCLKRGFDIVFSCICILILFPIMLVVSLLIWKEDRGSILFIQERTGLNGVRFKIFKFRSMKEEIPEKTYMFNPIYGVPSDFIFKSENDEKEHITKIGAFIRKTSIDELPQFFNVLKGDMSIVGPRPEIPEITCGYNKEQKMRLEKKAGITGLAQVNGRSDLKNGDKMKYDLYYVKNQSIKLELEILWKTIRTILTTKGAI
ncbi:MAG: sugar transferase [Carnobacterium sp.]|jgi:lipopolysaccharide/colanic/teichoic acid biosynthesis glycosyltransferase|uniref:Bacterial sugar transferase family protein n=2 Tax=Carnobacterium maltaromaticum TaxID=2751 RepID=K8EKU2_CARML|nr:MULTISPECIES: sugar transferase [Carnobacterium]AOA03061.1 glycosyl transferase [Carnobacterium maltaromaticum]MBC9787457.1 sugar transferase [Carnobacterium maltaromaticum]MBC9810167.1 sugar transferase [Carnobacterium maltaromaticum]MBQ6485590.1 sugar transferase [Carnobacterium sp.]MCI1817713.1 sugar transferase [Carnobacterium maltaromaticum]